MGLNSLLPNVDLSANRKIPLIFTGIFIWKYLLPLCTF